jgi:mono/diheme cytochrome c family protein
LADGLRRKGAMTTARKLRWALATSLVLGVLLLFVIWLNLRGDGHFAGEASTLQETPELITRGAYLARAGNCAACHTARGGAAYAGGRGIETPFGTVYAGNLTPDAKTGIGTWSAGDFWRAMHNGRSKSGRLLYPAFPYPELTQLTRADADTLFAFLRKQPAVVQANREHSLRFPYNTQWALALWRALYFRAQVFEPAAERSAEWNRGAYLVRGLGHCVACHASRNALGATRTAPELGGGLIPVQNWYAPSLAADDGAGVRYRQLEDVVSLLKTGTSAQGSALGPMAEVVFRSTQHMNDSDLRAIATFLQSLPQVAPRQQAVVPLEAGAMARGARVFKDHCAECHGAQGQGAPGAYPPLVGNRSVTLASPTNVLRVIIEGGFPPATQGHPRPYGMPPFGQSISRSEIADVATYVRNAWGHQASAVTELEVLRLR